MRLEIALVIDDRTACLADKDQAAGGWREWLRISNALSLRDQPTLITAITEVNVQGFADQAKHGTVPDKGVELPPGWQAAYDLASSGAERAFLEELARRAGSDPAAGWPAPPLVGAGSGERDTG